MARKLKAGAAFDALISKLVRVPKKELDAEIQRDAKRKAKRRKK